MTTPDVRPKQLVVDRLMLSSNPLPARARSAPLTVYQIKDKHTGTLARGPSDWTQRRGRAIVF